MSVAVCVLMVLMFVSSGSGVSHDYGDALSKSILFFEGQRSGKLPNTQRLSWRKDSALNDGKDKGMDLTGGYYDAGDNVKFNFPMAFTTVLLSWSVIEYGNSMGPEVQHALEAVRWATDYFLKCTNTRGVVYAQVGDPISDHNCWQRPEDMDTLRTTYAVSAKAPGSEVSAEMAAAMAAASLAFKMFGDKAYSEMLLKRAGYIFEFADRYRGSYNESIGAGACPFYCDYNGYQDELLWGAAWLYKASGNYKYWDYVKQNIINFKPQIEAVLTEFGWDAKHAGINVLVSQFVLNDRKLESTTPFVSYADTFICSVLPDSPTTSFQLTPGGLMHKRGADCNMQHVTNVMFLVLNYARYLKKSQHVIRCNGMVMTHDHLISFTKSQVDYILGSNPLGLSYMVGYGNKFPRRIHHRASSSPSLAQHPQHIACKAGTPYFISTAPNPNQLTGAVSGGPFVDDSFPDDRQNSAKSEPTTYITAPLVGLLAYFKSPSQSK